MELESEMKQACIDPIKEHTNLVHISDFNTMLVRPSLDI